MIYINDLNGITGLTHDYELSILARGIHGAFVAWAAWKEWSHESHMHCTARDSATMGTPIVHPETLWEWQKLADSTWPLLELIWYVGIYRIILAYAKLAGSWVCPKMKDGPILRQFSWGPQGLKNATDRILRLGVQARVAAATSGFWFSSTPLPMLLDFSAVPKVPKRIKQVSKKLVRTNRYYSSRTCFLNSRPYLNSFSDWFWHVSRDSEGRKIPLAIGLAGNWVLVI